MKESLNLINIFSKMKEHYKLILILPILGLILGLVVSLTIIKPEYEANTQVLVNQKESDSQIMAQQVQSDIQLVNTYLEVVTSPRILNKVSDELDNKYSEDELSSMITASSQSDSQLLNISVVSESEKDATIIANTISNVFSDEVPDIMNVDNVSVLSEAGKSEQVSPKILLNTVVGVFVGIIISILIILFYELIDKRIKSEDDVENELGIPVLGSIQKFK